MFNSYSFVGVFAPLVLAAPALQMQGGLRF
jgi:hypothetical protein